MARSVWITDVGVLALACLVLCHSLLPAKDPHWSWQPIQTPSIPEVPGNRHPIDAFVSANLQTHGLTLAPEADRRTLLRRLSFGLTGLPPSTGEVQNFLGDNRPDAYNRLIDRLLATPAYGEHWARQWLDLARFAETDGFEHDKTRPNAWRYRDWVIQALNDDLPYNEFVRQQIAGDQIHPESHSAAIATGFLLAGQDMPDINLAEERKHMLLNEMVSTVGSAFLGLSLGCSQCHDHPYDPLPQKEFYQLRAFFEGDLQLKERKLGNISARIMQTGHPASTYFMERGDFRRPAEIVHAAYPAIANPSQSTPQKGSRQELAKWITRPDNPLAMRLAANRIWQGHFGQPLASPEDFGVQGEPPIHPELLDWLAAEIPRQGWSLKSLHKLILTSETWKQASLNQRNDPNWQRRLERDPANSLLSRQHRRRLTGEMLRDTMLAVSGSLSKRKGGPGVRPPLPKEITATLLSNHWPVSPDEEDHRRRSIYLFARRNLRYPLFDLFDTPALAESCSRRPNSTTAPQALALLNSNFVSEAAERLAEYISKNSPEPKDAIREAYQLTLSRLPSKEESQNAEVLVGKAGNLSDLTLALFNLNEFLYLD